MRLPVFALYIMISSILHRLRYQLGKAFHAAEKKLRKKPAYAKNLMEYIDGKNIVLVHELPSPGPELILPLPLSVDGETDKFFIERQRVPLYPQYLIKIRNARLTTKNGLLKLPDGRYSSEHIHHLLFYIDQSPDHYHLFPKRFKTLKGKYYSLIGYCPGEHYHMMCDFTQRVYNILQLLPEDVKYLFPTNIQQPVLDAFELLGIPCDKRLIIGSGENLVIEELYWSPPSHQSGFDLPEALDFVSSTILGKSFKNNDHNFSSKVYISRRGKRKVVNEAELLALIKPLGFEEYELSRMSLQDQIDLFRSAKIIIGPHGAGLVNLMFCPPGTKVLELFPDPILYGGTCYWSLATAKGLDYTYLKCKTLMPVSDADIIVPLEKIYSWLTNINY